MAEGASSAVVLSAQTPIVTIDIAVTLAVMKNCRRVTSMASIS